MSEAVHAAVEKAIRSLLDDDTIAAMGDRVVAQIADEAFEAARDNGTEVLRGALVECEGERMAAKEKAEELQRELECARDRIAELEAELQEARAELSEAMARAEP